MLSVCYRPPFPKPRLTVGLIRWHDMRKPHQLFLLRLAIKCPDQEFSNADTSGYTAIKLKVGRVATALYVHFQAKDSVHWTLYPL